jgi:DNA-binding HxlR family transcriptional regulator
VGDRWTLLVIRDVVLGRHRFDELLESLGVASNILTDRLTRLAAEGILERMRYSERPERFEYHLTPKGRELGLCLLALMQWETATSRRSRRALRAARAIGLPSPSVSWRATDRPFSQTSSSSSQGQAWRRRNRRATTRLPPSVGLLTRRALPRHSWFGLARIRCASGRRAESCPGSHQASSVRRFSQPQTAKHRQLRHEAHRFARWDELGVRARVLPTRLTLKRVESTSTDTGITRLTCEPAAA